jgi:hypothetical protein
VVSNIARESCVNTIADGFLDGGVVLLFASGGRKKMSMLGCRRSHQKGAVLSVVLQLVVETTMAGKIVAWRLQKADLLWDRRKGCQVVRKSGGPWSRRQLR